MPAKPTREILGELVLLDGYPVARLIDQTPLYGGAPETMKGAFRDFLEAYYRIRIETAPTQSHRGSGKP